MNKFLEHVLIKLTLRKEFYEELLDKTEGPEDDKFELGRITGQIAELDNIIKLLTGNGESKRSQNKK